MASDREVNPAASADDSVGSTQPPLTFTGFTNASYGDGFADVYDRWYADVSPIDATVDLIAGLADESPVEASILELGVGTGRLAIPLAAVVEPRRVVGIDASEEMLNGLRANDPAGRIEVVAGDMIRDIPNDRFAVIFAAYNTFLNLPTAELQQQGVVQVARHLTPTGRFVIEANVPPDPFPDRDDIGVRSMSVDEVVLSVTRHEPDQQRASGQFIEFRDGRPPRLRPWMIRYVGTDELDEMARTAGLLLQDRWADMHRSPFGTESARHVSVYRLAIDGDRG